MCCAVACHVFTHITHRAGLTKVQAAEISVQCKDLYSKALKQQAAAGGGAGGVGGVGLSLPPLMPAGGGAAGDGSSKGWKFWKS